MSQHWTWKEAIWKSELPATTKLVLQALASHLNDMGDAMFPSQSRLSKYCSLSERAIITHLQSAEELGWIKKSKRNVQGKEWASNEYTASWPQGVNHVHPIKMSQVNDVHVRGERRSCDGVNDVHINSPIEYTKEHTKGVKWDLDEKFLSVKNSYLAIKPERVDADRSYAIWRRKGLGACGSQILLAISAFSRTEEWKKGYLPNLSDFLNDGKWRNPPKQKEKAGYKMPCL